MAMSPVIKNKPTTTSSLRRGPSGMTRTTTTSKNTPIVGRLAEGDLQLDFPGDSDRPVVDPLASELSRKNTLRLQPIRFRATSA